MNISSLQRRAESKRLKVPDIWCLPLHSLSSREDFSYQQRCSRVAVPTCSVRPRIRRGWCVFAGYDIAMVPAGVPRKPDRTARISGTSRGLCKELGEASAEFCPDGVGATTLDIVRAHTFVHEFTVTDVESTNIRYSARLFLLSSVSVQKCRPDPLSCAGYTQLQ